jgi:tetratricopeptide (TPR) repeat protein
LRVHEPSIRESLGDALFTMGEHRAAEEQFLEALRLREVERDATTLLRLKWKLADAAHWQGDYDRAIEVAEAGLAALDGAPPSPEAVNLMEVVTRSRWAQEDWEGARALAHRAYDALTQVPYFDSAFAVHFDYAWMEAVYRNFEESARAFDEMERICREHGDEKGLARCYHGRGDMRRFQEDYRAAVEAFRQSLPYGERVGDARLLAETHLELAHALILLEEDPASIEEHVRAGLNMAKKMTKSSPVASIPRICEMLGEAYLIKGNIEQGLVYIVQSMELGLPPSPYVLSLAERACILQGGEDRFLDFCRTAKRAFTLAHDSPQTGLLFWHSTPSSKVRWKEEAQDEVATEEDFEDGWEWSDPQGFSSCLRLPNGEIQFSVAPGASLSPALSVPKWLRPVAGDFILQAEMQAEGEGYEAGGLIVEREIGSAFLFTRDATLVRETRTFHELRLNLAQGDSLETVGRSLLPSLKLFLRVRRQGETFHFLSSGDGHSWHDCGEVTLPGEGGVRVGFFGSCREGSDRQTFVFNGCSLYRSALCSARPLASAGTRK